VSTPKRATTGELALLDESALGAGDRDLHVLGDDLRGPVQQHQRELPAGLDRLHGADQRGPLGGLQALADRGGRTQQDRGVLLLGVVDERQHLGLGLPGGPEGGRLQHPGLARGRQARAAGSCGVLGQQVRDLHPLHRAPRGQPEVGLEVERGVEDRTGGPADGLVVVLHVVRGPVDEGGLGRPQGLTRTVKYSGTPTLPGSASTRSAPGWSNSQRSLQLTRTRSRRLVMFPSMSRMSPTRKASPGAPPVTRVHTAVAGSGWAVP